MSRQKNLKRNLLICLLAGSAVMYTLPLHAATSVVANNALPTLPMVNGQIKDGYGFVTGGSNTNIVTDGLQMNITQNNPNAVIKWGSFDVGGSATVNFKGPESGYNTLNYVNAGGSMSQIYGTINANNNGNIFIVNPAGVQIGNSAQINVGSLYVSNKYLNESKLKGFAGTITPEMIDATQTADAELMSLGNINATNVTFEGDGRIVIDSERITNDANNATFRVNTNDAGNVVIGYDAYNEVIYNEDGTIKKDKGTYDGKDKNFTGNVFVNGTNPSEAVKGYMWVEDVEQLQAINTNLGGNYALRNSIDATSTSGWSDSEHDTNNEGFLSIGIDDNGKVAETNINNETKYGFYGNFDGIDYNIFGLTINREDTNNVGLFGVTHDANISNVTLVGGSITGQSVVGSVVGAALGSTHITNATNSASVTGTTDVGGIVGASRNERISDGNNGTISVDTNAVFTDLVNTGTIKGTDFNDNVTDTSISNTGGLIGYMYNGTLKGNSYNLGDVSSEGHNVGGLVGHAVNSTIGNPSVVNGKPVENVQVVYNRMDVTGAYNVGGIVGNMVGSTVQNAENSGNVLATGHTTEDYIYHSAEDDGRLNNDKLVDGTFENISNGVYEVTVSTNVANAGGIAGTSSGTSTITNVTNTANVSSNTNDYTQYGSEHEYYTAGNVGGIVGRAEDTDITNATNQENEIRGAHNVGGVAGYLGGNSTVSGGINDGGDIMATGARNENGFVSEVVRPIGNSQEVFIIGNIGGVVGYMDGDNVYVTGSANRGTVHSQDIAAENAANVLDTSKAANVGGIVGKIDRINTKGLDKIKADALQAAVSNSYNTGDVRGYTGVGGVVGMMYNGEVAGSYNLGHLRTTRIATDSSNIEAVNMGGIVGDTTEGTQANAVIYDVYNKGQIGDDTYTYYARHVGGIVGRLSGDISKAYNNGEIYNGYTATGGVVGWMYKGSVNNAFNTGNITVYNHDESTSQVGGIVGAAGTANGEINITNVYNLGTLRSIKANAALVGIENHKIGNNAVGGIIGAVMNKGTVNISGAYTTGNIYAGVQNEQGSMELDTENDMVGSIYGENRGVKNDNTGPMEYADIKRTNTYYIRPEDGVGFTQLGTSVNNKLYGSDNSNKWINYNGRFNKNEYQYDNSTGEGSLSFSSQSGGNVTGNNDNNWRLYPDGTPILNAFLPDSESYFDKYNNNTDLVNAGMDSVQYGTAYDPLLTIITANNNANGNLSFTLGAGDNELSISNAAGLVVYNAGLTLNNFSSSGSSSGYYGGLIYSDGVLTINAADNEGLAFGSGADIYGSSVALNADGTITIYGDVTATGNGTAANDDPDKAGSINIASNDSDINVYGTLTSATAGESVTIPGISAKPDSNWHPVDAGDSVSDPSDSLNTIGERYEHTTTSSNVNGNITITANGKTDKEGNLVSGGNVNLYFGNKGEGITTTGGDLTVTGTGDVYLDSDLDIGGNLTLNGTGADSEVVLDITNIGQVQAKNELAENTDSKVTAAEKLHDFMHHFSNNKGDGANIYLNAKNSNDTKITVDMWDGEKFDLKKFDTKDADGTTHEFKTEIDFMNVTVNGKKLGEPGNKHVKDYTYIWVSDGEQLKGIQQSAKENNNFLDFNFALKNDINASDIGNGYEAIGGTTGYNGTFDGRGNRIIGLTVSGDNAGIFSTVGKGGVVKDVNIYSGTFTGKTTAGAVAGENNGRIEGIVTFGNTVTVTGNNGNAGGIAGTNSGTVDDVESSGSVIGEGDNVIVGGLVGTNESGATVNNSYSNSAVTSTSGTDDGLGGVVGVNEGTVSLVDSLGVTNGTNSTKVGGVIGINSGTLSSAYNESIVNGYSNVGGIIGDNANTGTVSNIVNATSVTGEDESEDNVSQYVGGLVGVNSGSVTNGRNNGTITGTNYVGGMVGSNAQGATLTNLVNDSSAAIEGKRYVGGIAGSNSGTITADEKNDNLINRGSITGNKYVGGVAGENKDGGTIANTLNSVVLHAKGDNAQYFGGVVGQNSGLINGATNTSDIDITAVGGTYVGGIIGENTQTGTLQGEIRNKGSVAGKSQVGGIIGKNDNDKVLQGKEENRLIVTNDGTVDAEDGGAAGIFYENNGDIKYADISNNGVVNGGDKTGGTGGLFGINTGNITESTLANSGTVIGGGIVGGLIGKNSGDVSNSSLTNTGSVIGTSDVGGLIGYNTGTVTGGRNKAQETDKDGKVTAEKDSYYKYQIYNNGVVNVGTWNDKNSNGKVDDGEITGLQQGETSQNIGGLIGNNTTENGKNGSLTAGYNTGAINASGSTNVGGIAGSNSGTIDQVFNTVYNTNGTKGAITGGTNVGGLVGENTNNGTLSNAYNTTEVVGKLDNAIVGNAVGVNSGTISNIYATNTTGQLIGSGYDSNVSNAYSFSANEVSSNNVIVISDQDDQKDSGSYVGFDFSAADVDGVAADWKNYDGYSNPLLKVFLTKAKYTGNESFTYNGQDQGLTINGNVSAADKLDAYNNANSLLQATQNKNAGQDYLGIYSQQIAASGSGDTFNPNNLGYDIDVTYNIDKATITINLDEISRDYGNSTITNVTSGGNNYGFNFGDMVLTEEMKAELTADNLGFTQTSDGAVDNLKDGQKTNNAGTYSWYANFKLSDTLSGNYQFDTQGADSLTSVEGVSKVNQVQLTIDLKDITRVYGNLDKADYEFIANGLVNGDNIEDLILTVTSDGAIVEGSTDNPLKTNVVGDYEWSATVSNISNNLNTNYIITIDASAKSTVTPAQLDVVLGDVSHVYGSPNLNGYAASFGNNNGLVNGDSGSISVNVDRVTDAALSTDKQYTNDVDNYHWTVGEGGLSANGFDLGNYTVHYVDKGNSKVTPAQLDVVLGDVSHVYGSPNLNGYAASFGNNNGLVNGDSGSISVNVDRVTDAALSTDKQYTNDVDNYHWTVGEGGLSADGFKLGNYAINFVNEGSSKVTKANLTININDVNMTYGDLENWISGQYGYNASDVDGQKLVNGDSLADVIVGMTYNNTAYNSDGTTKNVAEGNFAITNDDVTQGTKYGNYNITFNNGTVTMDKKQITIGANNEQILVGETPNYSGTDIDSVLVNGDSLNGNYYYGVADGTIESVVGAHNGVIGVWIGGAFYDLSQNVDWTQAGNFFSNYEVNYIPGTLTVSAYDIPEDWPNNHWNYLFNDAPFDRNKDFRERKAEVNFVDGGMEI